MKKANNDFLTLTAAAVVVIVAAFVIMTSITKEYARGTIAPSDLTVLGADTQDQATEGEFVQLSQDAAGL